MWLLQDKELIWNSLLCASVLIALRKPKKLSLDISGIPFVNYHERYLCLPTMTSKNNKRPFGEIKENVKKFEGLEREMIFHNWERDYVEVCNTS